MRYIAKVHVLDIMDNIVISGYVYDADPDESTDHDPAEFSYTVPSLGLSDPHAWLLNALYRAFVQTQTRPSGSK